MSLTPYKNVITPWKSNANMYLTKFIPKLGKVVQTYSKYANKRQKTSKGRRSVPTGVTTQYDFTRQYRYKRMPRRKRRQWRKFVKKVEGAAEKNLGLRTVLFNDSVSCLPAAGAQDWCFMTLYGRSGGVSPKENGLKDFFEINVQDPEIQPTTKVHFKSAVMDVTMVNNFIGESSTLSQLMEVDVYELLFKNTEINFPTLDSALTQAINDTPGIGAGTPISLQTRGATPFHLGQFIRLAKFKILSKRKYLIGSGQAATMQIRLPKNHWVMGRDMADENEDFNYKGLTRGYLFIAKNVDANQDNTQLVVRATRTYTYKTEGIVENQTQNVIL